MRSDFAGRRCGIARDSQFRVLFFFSLVRGNRQWLIYLAASPLAFRPIDSESYEASVF